jgi:hypothetical protein
LFTAFETALGPSQTLVPRICFQSLFDALDSLLAGLLLLLRLGGGRFVSGAREGHTG